MPPPVMGYATVAICVSSVSAMLRQELLDMAKTICVYASSSNTVAPRYIEAAEKLGQLMAERGHTLIYGGGRLGLMGALARSVHTHGGHVIGVLPEKLRPQSYEAADELIVTPDMRERKARMEARADGFICLPGGFGTLEELLEILTLKQLGYHTKPVAIVNTGFFFDSLNAMFEHIYAEEFAKPGFRKLYQLAAGPFDALEYLEIYEPTPLPPKWEDQLPPATPISAEGFE
jgi:uncharacterized protein (TIGR00730 family)